MSKLTREDLEKILEIYLKAKEESTGKKVKTALLFTESSEDPEILVDNRTPEDIQ